MDDQRLVFIISQPRSGSTLLQRLVTGHPAICSTAEPWIMLPLLWPVRTGGAATDYNARHARRGITEFAQAVGRPEAWTDAVRVAATSLYSAAAAAAGTSHVLDKTPRYYHVIDELHATFPGATFVLLVRHPLDVLTSIWERHCHGDWTGLARRDRRHDLLTAPRAIQAARATLPTSRRVVVHYRDLVSDPRPVLEEICRAADLDFDGAMLEYTGTTTPGMGDQWGVTRHDRPVGDYVDVWDRRLDEPWKREFAAAHLRDLGPDLLADLGVDAEHAADHLATRSPRARRVGQRRWATVSTPPDSRSVRQRAALAWRASVHARGHLRAVAALALSGRAAGANDGDWGVRLA